MSRSHRRGKDRWAMGPAVGFLLLAVVAPSGHGAEPLAQGSLLGQVVGPDGKLIAGARVSMLGHDPKERELKPVAETQSDPAGRFRLGPIEPFYLNRFDLVVDAEGFARTSLPPQTVSVYPGRDFDLGLIRVDRGRVFTGQVVDVDGKPKANAEVDPKVYRHSMGHTAGDIGTRHKVMTDADGRFRTEPLAVGHLSLLVQAPERQLAHAGRPILPGGEEDLGVIRLEPDVPVVGTVQDEEGQPIADVRIGGTVGHEATTDSAGRFALRGFGPNPTFQLNVNKEGFAGRTGMVRVSDKGAIYTTRTDTEPPSPTRELAVVLKRSGVIEGTVVDEETGKPIRVERVVVCNFERKPSGEVVLRGCQSSFEPSAPGQFRAFYPAPDEYHLTFSAQGYHDAEAFTPKVTELKTIAGIAVTMKPIANGSTATMAQQAITGRITRNGQPVKSGWVGLWALRKPINVVNSPVHRGRTVVGEPGAVARAPIVDGSYSLTPPYQNDHWHVVVDEPGHPITQVGPVAVALDEKKSLDIRCTAGGSIRGHVKNIPAEWVGYGHVVAFSRTAVRADVRIEPNGDFTLPPLPPGEYGLKVGHDAYADAEVYPGLLARQHPESFKEMADPWKRAILVTVEPGREASGVEVSWPE